VVRPHGGDLNGLRKGKHGGKKELLPQIARERKSGKKNEMTPGGINSGRRSDWFLWGRPDSGPSRESQHPFWREKKPCGKLEGWYAGMGERSARCASGGQAGAWRCGGGSIAPSTRGKEEKAKETLQIGGREEVGENALNLRGKTEVLSIWRGKKKGGWVANGGYCKIDQWNEPL